MEHERSTRLWFLLLQRFRLLRPKPDSKQIEKYMSQLEYLKIQWRCAAKRLHFRKRKLTRIPWNSSQNVIRRFCFLKRVMPERINRTHSQPKGWKTEGENMSAKPQTTTSRQINGEKLYEGEGMWNRWSSPRIAPHCGCGSVRKSATRRKGKLVTATVSYESNGIADKKDEITAILISLGRGSQRSNMSWNTLEPKQKLVVDTLNVPYLQPMTTWEVIM